MTQLTIEFPDPIAEYLEAQVLAADLANQATPVTPQFWSSLRELAERSAATREFEGHEPC